MRFGLFLRTVSLVSITCAYLHLPITAAAQQGPAGTVSKSLLTRGDYRLQLSDTVEITFPFSPEYNQVANVQPDGKLALKEAPEVLALGDTLLQLEAKVVNAYKGVLRDPEVSVVLKDFQKPSYYASGEIGKPGRYELRAHTSLLQAISEAGGVLNERAKRTKVVIFRPQQNGTFEAQVLDLKAMLSARSAIEDYAIRPGDVIYVPQNTFSKFSRFIPSASMGTYLSPGGL